MKSPHNQVPDDIARDNTEKFIAKYHKSKSLTSPKGAAKPARARRAAAAKA
jgi:myo-inositol-1-phosphate synthase